MALIHILIYLLLIPGLCIIIGFLIGKKYGWHLRDNIQRNIQLKKAKKELDNLNNDWNKLNKELHKMEFNVIDIKKIEITPLTLEEQLKKAIEVEDYEKAAEIRNQLNHNKDE